MFKVMENMERGSERCLDSQLWHACAGAMVQMPPLNTKVFYFPQGHAEHAHGKVDFGQTRVPPLVPCRLSAMKYMADPDTDEVYVKMRLIPLREHELDLEDDCFLGNTGAEGQEKPPTSFAKTLTQSDANNGGGFSVPRYCAETIFPRLDYSAEPPVQTIIAKDMHGQCWKFRHIYRGTPRRHLLTTGWSNFVNQKRLVAGDSIVFLRAENGDLCVGIRRAKKGIGGGSEFSSGWNPLFGGVSGFLCGSENNMMGGAKGGGDEMVGRVAAESVLEAVACAVNGRPFEVVYYPRASSPEFCVKASVVKAAMQIQWCSGMRFKMPFETEDSSRISWFMGTISSVQVADPIRWPDSPWRLLQVVWDEPDLLQNVKCVNPWLVELVSNMPSFNLSAYSPPRKKQRFLNDPYFQVINQLPMPSFSSNLLNYTNSLCNIENNSSAGIQGARHAQFGLSPSDFPFNKLPADMLLGGFSRLDHATKPVRPPCGTYKNTTSNTTTNKTNVDISCLLTVGNPNPNFKELNATKAPHILLFGKLIHTEQHCSNTSSASTTGNSVSEGNSLKTSNASDGLGSALHQNSPIENNSDGGSPWYKDQHKADLGSDNVNTLCIAL
ncbi:auxin response factor 18-like [Vigna unguiculata]|uniref:Auxin response factor n=1 Tax=Vigna unguiculata TaxID=3917 RepID=A0A4D6N2A8_VIGUN|nr:auxin response factor 18-like [Vigna unguiculata]QCE07940.1 auxin response factor [Vigna unguiculata]